MSGFAPGLRLTRYGQAHACFGKQVFFINQSEEKGIPMREFVAAVACYALALAYTVALTVFSGNASAAVIPLYSDVTDHISSIDRPE